MAPGSATGGLVDRIISLRLGSIGYCACPQLFIRGLRRLEADHLMRKPIFIDGIYR